MPTVPDVAVPSLGDLLKLYRDLQLHLLNMFETNTPLPVVIFALCVTYKALVVINFTGLQVYLYLLRHIVQCQDVTVGAWQAAPRRARFSFREKQRQSGI